MGIGIDSGGLLMYSRFEKTVQRLLHQAVRVLAQRIYSVETSPCSTGNPDLPNEVLARYIWSGKSTKVGRLPHQVVAERVTRSERGSGENTAVLRECTDSVREGSPPVMHHDANLKHQADMIFGTLKLPGSPRI